MSTRPFLRALAGAALVGACLGCVLGLALLVWEPGRPRRADWSDFTVRNCTTDRDGAIRCEVVRVR